MRRRWAGWAGVLDVVAAGGCSIVAGLGKDYYLLDGGGGGGGRNGSSSAATCSGSGGIAGACPGSAPPSCMDLPSTCGPMANESCCATRSVPGGMYLRSYDGVTNTDSTYPAKVSDFKLDRFEVTVGRFRAFVNAYPASKPAADAGKHPLIAGSGWDPAWDMNLPIDKPALTTEVTKTANYTWTDAPAGKENLPMNGLSWYVAFAFCAWDGGRLPTEAEWNYAATAGDQQRVYPWSNPPSSQTLDDTYAVYGQDGGAPPVVGSKSPKGDGKYEQADLAGSMWEWNLDWFAPSYPTDQCVDCANLLMSPDLKRVARGGGWRDSMWSSLLSASRSAAVLGSPYSDFGVRCARPATP